MCVGDTNGDNESGEADSTEAEEKVETPAEGKVGPLSFFAFLLSLSIFIGLFFFSSFEFPDNRT